jgi:hypothetical protein
MTTSMSTFTNSAFTITTSSPHTPTHPHTHTASAQLRDLFGPNSTQPSVLPLLGNFIENHDEERFLCEHNDIRMYE